MHLYRDKSPQTAKTILTHTFIQYCTTALLFPPLQTQNRFCFFFRNQGRNQVGFFSLVHSTGEQKPNPSKTDTQMITFSMKIYEVFDENWYKKNWSMKKFELIVETHTPLHGSITQMYFRNHSQKIQCIHSWPVNSPSRTNFQIYSAGFCPGGTYDI